MANQRAMGIGNLGFNHTIFKRKFRYTFQLTNICGSGVVPEHYVKLASRPNLSIEETEINFLNGKFFIPGKATWETITVTYIDVASLDSKPLYDWLASVYDYTDPTLLYMGSTARLYSGVGIIKLLDGCGTTLETWTLEGVWPTAVNFGDLDYSSSEEATIELTLRYHNVSYQSNCPEFVPQGCCGPCGSENSAGFVGPPRPIG